MAHMGLISPKTVAQDVPDAHGLSARVSSDCILLLILIAWAPLEQFTNDTVVSGSVLKYYILFMNVLMALPIDRRKKFRRIQNVSLLLVVWMVYLILNNFRNDGSVFARGYDHIQSIGLMVLTFVTVSMIRFNKKEINLILYTFVFSGVLLGLMLLRNPATVGSFTNRFTVGMAYDPNNVSAFLTVPFVIVFYLIFRKSRYVGALLVSAGVISLAILMTGSRGGTLAAIGGVAVLFLSHRRSGPGSYLIVIFGSAVFFLFLADRFISTETMERAFDTSKLIVSGGYQQELRWELWRVGLEAFQSSPIIGVGFGQFAAQNLHGIHNTFLWVLVDLGLVGFVPFLWVWYLLLRQAWRLKATLVYAVLVGTSINILFLDSLNKKFLWLGLILAIVINRAYQDLRRASESGEPISKRPARPT